MDSTAQVIQCARALVVFLNKISFHSAWPQPPRSVQRRDAYSAWPWPQLPRSVQRRDASIHTRLASCSHQHQCNGDAFNPHSAWLQPPARSATVMQLRTLHNTAGATLGWLLASCSAVGRRLVGRLELWNLLASKHLRRNLVPETSKVVIARRRPFLRCRSVERGDERGGRHGIKARTPHDVPRVTLTCPNTID
jgi:hypothetical protein